MSLMTLTTGSDLSDMITNSHVLCCLGEYLSWTPQVMQTFNSKIANKEFMGRTIPSYRIATEIERSKWKSSGKD